jgi:transcriptional regulator GlxA family with amidase domain
MLAEADMIILPRLAHPTAPITEEVLAALRGAAERGVRLDSICVGAFILAAAGLLDGLQATTHWNATDLLTRYYPTVQVDPAVLFVDNGQILTSAALRPDSTSACTSSARISAPQWQRTRRASQ